MQVMCSMPQGSRANFCCAWYTMTLTVWLTKGRHTRVGWLSYCWALCVTICFVGFSFSTGWRTKDTLGTMDVCTKFHGNPCNSWDISVWTNVVDWTDCLTDIAIPQSHAASVDKNGSKEWEGVLAVPTVHFWEHLKREKGARTHTRYFWVFWKGAEIVLDFPTYTNL